MVARKASLQHKVLLGYMILIMAVCGMVCRRMVRVWRNRILYSHIRITIGIGGGWMFPMIGGSRDLSVSTWMDIPENCLGRGSVGIVNTLKYPRRIKRNGFIWISMVRWRMPKCGLMGIKWANGLSDTALFGSI